MGVDKGNIVERKVDKTKINKERVKEGIVKEEVKKEVVKGEAVKKEVVKGDVVETAQKAEKKLSVKSKIVLCVCGAIIGFINGFFGGGGGMIVVPLLEKVLQLPNKYAHATAIVIILPISFVSACIYLLSGNLQTIPFITVGAGVLAGGVLGAFLLKFLPAKVVRIIFVLIMLAGGIRLLF